MVDSSGNIAGDTGDDEGSAREEEERAAKERAAKEAKEQAAKERAAKEEEERAARERAAKERAAKEEEERAARERAAKEAKEQAAKERAAKEAKERAANEAKDERRRESRRALGRAAIRAAPWILAVLAIAVLPGVVVDYYTENVPWWILLLSTLSIGAVGALTYYLFFRSRLRPQKQAPGNVQATSGADPEDPDSVNQEDDHPDELTRNSLSALGAVAILTIVLVAALGGVIYFLDQTTNVATAEVVLTPVILVSTVVLVLGMGALAVLFKRLQLADRKAAMGMPEGSIRAIIALLLIILFFVLSVYLFSQLRQSGGAVGTLEGITLAEVNAIPADQIVSRTAAGGTTWDPLESTCRHASLSIL